MLSDGGRRTIDMIALRGARGATARTVARSALAIPAIGAVL